MLILTLRTDKPQAELGLYEDRQPIVTLSWQADRQLVETIHLKLKELLDSAKKQLSEVEGIACFEGPGSFTGLRIGLSMATP